MKKVYTKLTEVSSQSTGNGRIRRNKDVPSKNNDPKREQDPLPSKNERPPQETVGEDATDGV